MLNPRLQYRNSNHVQSLLRQLKGDTTDRHIVHYGRYWHGYLLFLKPLTMLLEISSIRLLNLLLQILDDGRCTDSNGRTVDFKNTIIIMTSNLGSEYILNGDTSRVLAELKDNFRPEFINRIDEVIVFNPLTKAAITLILDKIINDIENRLSDVGIKIKLTDNARNQLINDGYDINFGARPLKRLVSRTLETELAKNLIQGNIKPREIVIVDYINDNYVLKEE